MINPFFKRLQRLIDLVLLLLLLPSKTFNKQLTQNKMKHYLIVLVALFISSSAIFAKENTFNKLDNCNPISFHLFWQESNKNKNKDLPLPFDAYYSNQRLVIVQDTPILDCYYIVNKRGVVVLNGEITPTDDINSFTISLTDLRNDEYTLYLYEGTKFWYGTFTIKQ